MQNANSKSENAKSRSDYKRIKAVANRVIKPQQEVILCLTLCIFHFATEE